MLIRMSIGRRGFFIIALTPASAAPRNNTATVATPARIP